MSVPNWNDLLPSYEQIQSMSPEQLKAADQASESYAMTISYGIAAVGTLLANTADSGELGMDTARDLGWLIEALGSLSARLDDTGGGIRDRRNAIKRED
ncbi:hypothetical protein E0E52_13010 [Azotobacter chroococcum]|uniref:hypothetical protein n=1 Tax=Azotobacter chroococcum TaxID=353 RepID=UPI0010390E13|nr:hypothetical protein [Azotobacter chroococcum]TBW04261.1 hypothetical protein E0E52_13010 [Azotobacter chroococcum]